MSRQTVAPHRGAWIIEAITLVAPVCHVSLQSSDSDPSTSASSLLFMRFVRVDWARVVSVLGSLTYKIIQITCGCVTHGHIFICKYMSMALPVQHAQSRFIALALLSPRS